MRDLIHVQREYKRRASDERRDPVEFVIRAAQVFAWCLVWSVLVCWALGV